MIEFSVNMVNRPGQLATLARELGSAGVNIETLAAFSTGPEAYVKLVVDNDDTARIVLKNAGVPFEERRIVSATLHDHPGALAQMAEALAATGVNIDAMYLVHSSSEGLRFALAVDDPDTAQKHLDEG
ncbi:MAG: ACT domain-containing protein [Acidimicrobiia bacterium]|nr:ACT domain-containing protein [Acidimicrobiia bacterium]